MCYKIYLINPHYNIQLILLKVKCYYHYRKNFIYLLHANLHYLFHIVFVFLQKIYNSNNYTSGKKYLFVIPLKLIKVSCDNFMKFNIIKTYYNISQYIYQVITHKCNKNKKIKLNKNN